MRRTAALASAAALTAAVLTGCSDEGGVATPNRTVTASPQPAQTSDPTEDPTDPGDPASEEPPGPPRLVDTVATGLQTPWGIGFLPNGDAIVTERDTRKVLLIKARSYDVSEVGLLDAAAPLGDQGGEAGLLGVAVSPDFADDRMLFFYLTTATDNRIVKAPLRGDRLGAPRGHPRRHPQRLHPRRRPARVRTRRPSLRLHRRDRRARAGPGPRHPGRQDPADHHRRRPGAGQPVRRLRDLELRPPQRPGTRLRRPGPAVGLGVRRLDLRRAQPDPSPGRTTAGPQVEGRGGRVRAGRPAGRVGHRRRLPLGPGLGRRAAVAGGAARRAALACRRRRRPGQRPGRLLHRQVRPDAHRRGDSRTVSSG